MIKKILLATDGSEHAMKAAEYAKNLALKFEGAEITVLYVAHVPDDLLMKNAVLHAFDDDINLDKVLAQNSQPVLTKTLEVFADTTIKVNTLIQTGNPAEEICLIAKTDKYDLVVIGSRGLGTIKGLFLGSVSDRVAHICNTPVMIVK